MPCPVEDTDAAGSSDGPRAIVTCTRRLWCGRHADTEEQLMRMPAVLRSITGPRSSKGEARLPRPQAADLGIEDEP